MDQGRVRIEYIRWGYRLIQIIILERAVRSYDLGVARRLRQRIALTPLYLMGTQP